MGNPQPGKIYQERYLILEEIGAGGMGVVYHAKQVDVDREVALKLMRKEAASDENSLARFYREFQILCQLSHPNIMIVYGMATEDSSVPFAVCEYLDGISLRTLLANEGSLEWPRATSIALQIANALQCMHKNNVVHRDLKPDNIMILKKPEPDFVKLVDFGLSRNFDFNSDETHTITWTGQVLGSAFYMAPELVLSPPDARSDIYAFGAVLFEMLSGEILFDAQTTAAAMYRHNSENVLSRFEAIKCNLPEKLFAIVLKCLAKDPDSRFQNVQDLLVELQSVIDHPVKLCTGKGFLARNAGASVKIVKTVLVTLLVLLFGTYCFGIYTYESVKKISKKKGRYHNQLELRPSKHLSADPRFQNSLSSLTVEANKCEPQSGLQPALDLDSMKALSKKIELYHSKTSIRDEKVKLAILLARVLVCIARTQSLNNDTVSAVETLNKAALYMHTGDRLVTEKEYYGLRSSLVTDPNEVEYCLHEMLRASDQLARTDKNRVVAYLSASDRFEHTQLKQAAADCFDKAVRISKDGQNTNLAGLALESENNYLVPAKKLAAQERLKRQLQDGFSFGELEDQSKFLFVCGRAQNAKNLLRLGLDLSSKTKNADLDYLSCVLLLARMQCVQGAKHEARKTYDLLLPYYENNRLPAPGFPSKKALIEELKHPFEVVEIVRRW